MEIFSRIVQRVTKGGTVAAGVFLWSAMFLVVASVISRQFNVAITGSHELMELMISVTIAFALVYAALQKRHVVVKIIVSRFSVRTAAIVSIVVSFLSLAIWGLIAGATAQLVYEQGMRAISETLEVPYLPFKIVLILGVLLFSLTYISDIFEELKKVRGKWNR
jgi:TRAP-type C4-dicarboxylate transport system permease small subunit